MGSRTHLNTRERSERDNTEMAGNSSTAPRKRIGDYNPDVEKGEVLDGIDGVDVEVASIEFDRRNGRSGRYTLSVITLTDGRVFHTGSPIVAERLAKLYEMASMDDFVSLIESGRQPAAPDGTFPIIANFHREKSQSNPGSSFWTVD